MGVSPGHSLIWLVGLGHREEIYIVSGVGWGCREPMRSHGSRAGHWCFWTGTPWIPALVHGNPGSEVDLRGLVFLLKSGC